MRRLLAFWLTLAIIISVTFADNEHIEVPDKDDLVTENMAQDESINYRSPYAEPGKYYFSEHFDDTDKAGKKWIKSTAKKDDTSDDIAKYDGLWLVEAPQRQILKGDLGLVLKSKAKHSAISARLTKPFVFSDKPLVLQYEVQLQDGQECGGAYLKLLSSGKETTDLKQFNDKTPYTIMFGPDKCGNDMKLHFIFRHVNPLNGSITEKHCKKPKDRLDELFKDKQPHLYTLVLKPDNTYIISIDHKVVNEGSLLNDFNPPVNPPKEIDDPNHQKPSDWDEREKINDPDATKPDDWDEDAPAQIPDPNASKPDDWLDDEEMMMPDPNAVKPDDWDTEMDGEWEAPLINNPKCDKIGCGLWEAPMIPNPNYKGKWRAPLIDNPNYQGKWAPRKISNPDFFEDLSPFKLTAIAAIGIELWSMSNEILFDNIIITDSMELADNWAEQTFDLKQKVIDKDAESFVTRIVKFTNENPFMWAVYLVVIGLLLAFIWYLCCSPDKKDKPVDNTAKAKKTDEMQPDVLDENYSTPQSESMAKSKTDLDEPVEEKEQEQAADEEEQGDSENDDVHEEAVDAAEDLGPNEDEETEIVSSHEDGKTNTEFLSEGTRKRKPRKE